MRDLGSRAVRRKGSSPFSNTMELRSKGKLDRLASQKVNICQNLYESNSSLNDVAENCEVWRAELVKQSGG